VTPVSDAIAMNSARDGEEPLDRRLVAELPALRAYLRRIAGRGAVAGEVEDLAQESLTRALSYRASFDPARALGPWLRGVALRAFLDQKLRRARAPGAIEEEPAATGAAAELRVEQREELVRALEVLGAAEREVLLRFHARSQSIKEIAAELALPEGTVKSHLHRARRRLAEGGRS